MKIEVQILGVGNGTSKVLKNEPSTSWVLLINDEPTILFDLGLGVTFEFIKLFSSLPKQIYLSHNHSDHSGELPVLLATQKTKGVLVNLISSDIVMTKILSHRLDELKSTGFAFDKYFNSVCVSVDQFIQLSEYLSIKSVKSLHSEDCFGVIIKYKEKPIIGWSADSGFSEELYNRLFIADQIILDARINGNDEHADFVEIENYIVEKNYKNKNILILGYGNSFLESKNYKIGIPQQKYIIYDDMASY